MKKIKYVKIDIQDFKCFNKLGVNFNEVSNRISGKNGAGKTSLSEAIVFALTGKSLVGGKLANEPIEKDGLIKKNYNQVLDLEILVNEHKFEIKKEIVNANVKKLIINKVEYSKLLDFNNKILEILGVESFEEFLILSNPKYLNSLSNKEARQYIISLVNNKKDYEFLTSVETNENQNGYKKIITLDLAEGITLNQLLESKENEIKNTKKIIETEDVNLTSKNDTLTKISQDQGMNENNFEQLKIKKEEIKKQILKIEEQNSIILNKQSETSKLNNQKNELEFKKKLKEKEIFENEGKIKTYTETIKIGSEKFRQLASQPLKGVCPVCKLESPHSKEKIKKEVNEKLNSYKVKLTELSKKLEGFKTLVLDLTKEKEFIEKRINVIDSQKSVAVFEEEKIESTEYLRNEIFKINETIGSFDAIQIIKNEILKIKQKLLNDNKQYDRLEEEKNYLKSVLKVKAEHYNNFINSKLQDCKVKLFEIKKNGNLKDIFTIERNGIKFELLNWAGQINSGLELLGFMQQQKGVSLPFFVDNAESVNKLQQVESQKFTLFVNENELKIS